MYLLTVVLEPAAGGHGRRAPPVDEALARLRSLPFVGRIRQRSTGGGLHVALFVSATSETAALDQARAVQDALCPGTGAWCVIPGSLILS